MLNENNKAIYIKNTNWIYVANIILYMILMSLFLLLNNNGGSVIFISLIALFSVVIILYFLAISFYQLSLSDKCITEKKILKRKVDYDWKDLKKIQVSLDNTAIYLLYEGNVCLILRNMKHADKLLACLCEKLGNDKIEIGIHR